MQSNDVKLNHLTRNLLELAECVATHKDSEAQRLRQLADELPMQSDNIAEPTAIGTKRGRAAVVTWDLGHNPVGRAFVLYQLLQHDWHVDLIGPLWSRYGDELWEPLRNRDLNVRSFRCATFSDFIPKAEALVATQHYDLVVVCKPRLPSLYLGALLKEASGCPLVLDVDDCELSFFADESTASLVELKADVHRGLYEPYEELGTRYAQSLIATADAVTVSNVALRSKFGGHIVRHARDEHVFCNSTDRRAQARQRLGIAESDFALVFIGTPRRHKGVVEVARALHELNDADTVFHIVGTITNEELLASLEHCSNARLVFHTNCAFDDLPDLLAGADLVPLIQDVDHAISQYQIPAKISDALSLGVPVMATPTPPIADLIAGGILMQASTQSLPSAIKQAKAQLLADRRAASGCQDAHDQVKPVNAQRRNFVNEFGLRVNRTRLNLAIEEASEQAALNNIHTDSSRSLFKTKHQQQGLQRLPMAWQEMVKLFRNHYRAMRKHRINLTRKRRGDALLPSSTRQVSKPIGQRLSERLPSIISAQSVSYDIAFFWKQNDTGLYGRRSDMIAKGLVSSGRVGKMVQFDAPISVSSLNQHFTPGQPVRNGQQHLLLENLIDRQLGVYDTATLRHRTHVHRAQQQTGTLLGQPLYPGGSHIRYVNEQLEEAGMRASRTIAWFCPVIWDAPELIKQIGFGGVVADLIDDQRVWDVNAKYRSKLDENYRQTLEAADIVFANCLPLAQAMQSYTPCEIHVVPNGAERFSQLPPSEKPAALQGIPGPIAGYVGNLRDRIDWTLLHEVVTALPDVSFVFFGPSNDNPNADSLARYPNVTMLGVVSYAELPFHLQHLDVALVPHLNNQLTARMNPLKVYNYFAAGLPIVSSEVSNLENLGNSLHTATTSDDFIRAIQGALTEQIDTSSAQWQATMDSIAWDTRVASILEILDQSLHRSQRKSA